MRTAYQIIRTHHPVETREVDWPEEPSLATIRALVEPLLSGARMEHISVLYLYKLADMFVDELSVMRGLPINPVATSFYRATLLKRLPETDPNTLAAVYGTAVLFERRIWL